MCWEMDYKFFAEQKKAQEFKNSEQALFISSCTRPINRAKAPTAKERRSKRLRPRSKPHTATWSKFAEPQLPASRVAFSRLALPAVASWLINFVSLILSP